MDVRVKSLPLVMSERSPKSDKKSTDIKVSKKNSSHKNFTGRDVKHQAAVTQSQISSPVASEQASLIHDRKIASHRTLLSPKELADEIRLETKKELSACKALPIFFVAHCCKEARLTKSAEQRMYRYGLSTDDVKSALQLSHGKFGLHQTGSYGFDRFYFIANPTVIVHLMELACKKRIYNPVFMPEIKVFEYFDEYYEQWMPAEARRSVRKFPEPLVDLRYLKLIENSCLEQNGLKVSVTVDEEKYLVDKVAECLTEMHSAFWHTLHSPLPDSAKVTFLSNLTNMESLVPATEDGSIECGVVAKKRRFSATEYLAHIRCVAGGLEYQCDNNDQ